MADHQKIHPAQDPEARQKPTAPLMTVNSTQSEKGDPEQNYPPYGRTIPLKYSKPPKRRSCCCRCLCWTVCFLVVILILIASAAGILYLIFRPKIPKYSVDSMRITQFNLNNDMSLYATFEVNITARNPNKKIGIYYEDDSNLSVWYTGTKLCEGSLPKFYQGHRNTTLLNLTLTGQTNNASNLLASLDAQRQTGSIPLNLRAKVPVRIKLGKLKLMKWKPLVKCSLHVNSLDANNAIRIRDSSCKFRFRL